MVDNLSGFDGESAMEKGSGEGDLKTRGQENRRRGKGGGRGSCGGERPQQAR